MACQVAECLGDIFFRPMSGRVLKAAKRRQASNHFDEISPTHVTLRSEAKDDVSLSKSIRLGRRCPLWVTSGHRGFRQGLKDSGYVEGERLASAISSAALSDIRCSGPFANPQSNILSAQRVILPIVPGTAFEGARFAFVRQPPSPYP